MIRLGRVAANVSLLLLAVASEARAQGGLPTSVAGAWDVERVLVDKADQMHWGFRPDDPQLLARELIVARDEVHFSADKDACKQRAWQPLTTTWGRLFARGIRRAPGGGRSTHPSPADFELAVESTGKATGYLLCVEPGNRGADEWLDGRWIALQRPEFLVMHYSDQVLLVLRRRPANAKPRASFPCEKATTLSEKAICGSFELAGWDRSVAVAWHQLMERSTDDRVRRQEEQKEWLRKRDQCGESAPCLEEMLWRRVEAMTQQ